MDRIRAGSRIGGALLVAIGAVALAGWALDIPTWRGVSPSFVSLKVNAALLFVVYGLALALRREGQIVQDALLGGIVASAAALTMLQTIFGWSFGIDELFVLDPTDVGIPGRMPPAVEASFLCLGVALPLMNSRWHRLAAWLCAVAGSVSFFALCGYLYDVQGLFGIGVFAPVALNAAVGLGVAALSTIACRPRSGLAALVASDTAAAAAARRLLPVIVGAPLVLGWCTVHAEERGWVGTSMGNALDVLGTVMSLCAIAVIALASLNRAELAQREAAATLARQQEELSTTLRSIGDAVIATDGQGCIVRMNRVAETLTACSEGEARGQPLSEVFHIVDTAGRAVESPVGQVLRDGVVVELANHTFLVAPDGGRRPIGDSAAPIRGADGIIRGVVLVFRDMTAEMEARQTRENAARRAQFLANLTRDLAVMGADVGALLELLTQNLVQAVGDTAAAFLVDASARQLSTSDYALHCADPEVEADLLRLLTATGIRLGEGLSGKVAESGEAQLIARTDPEDAVARVAPHLRDAVRRLAPHSMLSVPMRARGRILGVVTMTRQTAGRPYTQDDLDLVSDIANRAAIVVESALLLRQLEGRVDELARAEEKFRSLLETAPEALIVVDQAGRIQLVNAQAEATFGYSREEMIGELIEMLVPDAASGAHAGLRRAHVAAGNLRRPMGLKLDVHGRRRDGTEFPADISLGPIATPEGVWTAAAVRDVTDRRRLEAASRRAFELEEQNQRAEEASRLKSEFLANMSHELRTPLNAILGFTGLIVAGKAGPVSDRHREYLTDVIESGKHLLHLINDILDHSKIEAGRMGVDIEPVDLVHLGRELLATSEGLATGRRIELRIRAPDGLPTIWSDRRKLKQILFNLLSNAIKFTEDGGSVELRVDVDPDRHARLAVTDTGIGIAANDIDRLFVPFQQLDSGLARKFGGTGLGLALSRRLAEALGGTLSVESRPGQGTTFLVDLPPVQATGAHHA